MPLAKDEVRAVGHVFRTPNPDPQGQSKQQNPGEPEPPQHISVHEERNAEFGRDVVYTVSTAQWLILRPVAWRGDWYLPSRTTARREGVQARGLPRALGRTPQLASREDRLEHYAETGFAVQRTESGDASRAWQEWISILQRLFEMVEGPRLVAGEEEGAREHIARDMLLPGAGHEICHDPYGLVFLSNRMKYATNKDLDHGRPLRDLTSSLHQAARRRACCDRRVTRSR